MKPATNETRQRNGVVLKIMEKSGFNPERFIGKVERAPAEAQRP